ncbi:hypothetical protein D6774_02365, partial [Candidatus Woesearchaeota archaeon]
MSNNLFTKAFSAYMSSGHNPQTEVKTVVFTNPYQVIKGFMKNYVKFLSSEDQRFEPLQDPRLFALPNIIDYLNRNEKADLIVSALHPSKSYVPGEEPLNGVEVVRRLREQQNSQQIPLIITYESYTSEEFNTITAHQALLFPTRILSSSDDTLDASKQTILKYINSPYTAREASKTLTELLDHQTYQNRSMLTRSTNQIL